MTKAFISYHHDNDQSYKVHLSEMATYFGCFEDGSVNTGDISDDGRSSQAIRRQIRDVYLRDSQVTILLCGQETKHRKHVDWEVNHRSGILVINLPGVSSCWEANLPAEKYQLYSDYYGGWASFETRTDFEARYPRMPDRIIDQLVRVGVTISVVPWERIEYDPNALRWLIDETAKQRFNNNYDLSRSMRRNDATSRLANALTAKPHQTLLGMADARAPNDVESRLAELFYTHPSSRNK